MLAPLFNKATCFYEETIPMNSKKRCFCLRVYRLNQEKSIELTVISNLQTKFSLDGEKLKPTFVNETNILLKENQ